MANHYFATYLIDHLAGSAVALELLEDLATAYAGTALASFFVELKNDIAADQQELHILMDRLSIVESQPRKAFSWLTEKFVELKLRLDDSARGPLRLLESLEILSLGVDGKLAMWDALNAAAEECPRFQGLADYERLAQRAKEQRRRLEVVRLEAAKATVAAERRT